MEVKPKKRKLYDPDDQNEDRAEWAQSAIDVFQTACKTDDEDALADLLCNLMHLSDRKKRQTGWDFNSALARAVMNYDAETSKNGGF